MTGSHEAIYLTYPILMELPSLKTPKSIVGGVYDRAYFVDSKKNVRS